MISIPSSILKYKVLSIGGTNEYVSMGNVHDFERTDPFSISFWAKWSNASIGSLVNKLTTTVPFRGYDVFVGDVVGFTLNNSQPTGGSNWLAVVTVESSFNDSKWHHIVSTYDGSSDAANCRIYIDGISRSLTIAANSLSDTTLNTAQFAIGARPGPPVLVPTVADVQDLAVYNKALSAAEVTEIYGSRCPPDLTVVGPVANLVGYWLLGSHLGDTNLAAYSVSYPTVPAVTGSNGTMTNMETTDIITRV